MDPTVIKLVEKYTCFLIFIDTICELVNYLYIFDNYVIEKSRGSSVSYKKNWLFDKWIKKSEEMEVEAASINDS